MRDEYRELRPLLQDWGVWCQIRLNIDYPSSSVSCNPELHVAINYPEPGFKPPKWNAKLSDQENRRRQLEHEQGLREHYHAKAIETKPRRAPSIPRYIPHVLMSQIDIEIKKLSDVQRQVIEMRYRDLLKGNEISVAISRTLDTVNWRLKAAHKNLKPLLIMLGNYAPRETYIIRRKSVVLRRRAS